MACSKYTLTNTGSTVVNFSYRRCDDSMWDYQVELLPNQVKNIWVINGTYTVAPSFKGSISLVNNGVFPPVFATPTPTPTPSTTPPVTPTPSVTATATNTPTNTASSTVTPTPSVTATITPSPTEPVRYIQAGVCHDEISDEGACDCIGYATVWTDGVDFASSTVAFSDASGPNTGNPDGWYVQDNIIYRVLDDCGIGCTTGGTIVSNGPCGVTPTPTATETSTPTPTPTNTETPTQTPTNTPTPTSPLQVFNVFTGATSNGACNSSETLTLYAFDPLFDANTIFYNDPSGVTTIDLTGFYTYSGQVVELDSNGNIVGGFTLCSVLPTPTPTATSTSTPTPTPTVTQTPTQTFAWYTYSLGTGATANDACLAFVSSPQTIYGTIAGGVGPNVGEYLYETPGRPLTDAVPDGFYSNGTAWFQVTGGAGQITTSDPNGCI